MHDCFQGSIPGCYSRSPATGPGTVPPAPVCLLVRQSLDRECLLALGKAGKQSPGSWLVQ